jgi:hypothetical protein
VTRPPAKGWHRKGDAWLLDVPGATCCIVEIAGAYSYNATATNATGGGPCECSLDEAMVECEDAALVLLREGVARLTAAPGDSQPCRPCGCPEDGPHKMSCPGAVGGLPDGWFFARGYSDAYGEILDERTVAYGPMGEEVWMSGGNVAMDNASSVPVAVVEALGKLGWR